MNFWARPWRVPELTALYFSDATIDFGDGFGELFLARRLSGGIVLARHFGACQFQRLQLARLFGVGNGRAASLFAAALQFLDTFLDTAFRIHQSFT
jgi:hypothetical protein